MNNNLKNISMNGRIAYAVQCIEKYLLEKYPNKDCNKLSIEMWKVTSEYFDKWHDKFMEIIPEYLYEFGENYQEDKWDYLNKEDFNYWINFYNGIIKDANINKLLMNLAEISMVYCYTTIPEEGKESLKLIENIEKILNDNKIELPKSETFLFSKFVEKNGWGNDFDGKKYSLILNK